MPNLSSKPKTCFCGNNKPFSECCKVVHLDHSMAVTAESLMRSRYSAFVVEDTAHILKTWHESKRPRQLNFEDHPVTWINLTINATELGGAGDTTGTVSFTSTYLESGQLCNLTEKSNFIKASGLWFYVDGVCEVTKKKVERNRPCPCGSGKKFKRCCV